jgi:outer membrane protein TolC
MVEGSTQNIKSVRADFLPSISSSYSVGMMTSESSKGPTETEYIDQDIRNFSVRLSQVLYAGSKISNTFAKAKAQEQMYIADKELAKLELIYNIETTFFQLMKAKQDVSADIDTVKRLKESVKSADAFFQKQLIPYVDLLQAKVDLADAEQQMSMAKNSVNRIRVALFSLMNMPGSETGFTGGLDYYLSGYHTTCEACQKKALKNRPDLESLKNRVIMYEKEAAISSGSYLPVIKFDAGYYDQDKDYDKPASSGDNRDQRNRYWSAGLYATWNLFDGGRAWYQKGKYNYEVKKVKELIKDAENMIKTGIHKALFSLSEAELRIKSTSEAIIAAREYYKREDKRLQTGIGTIPALLDAHARLTRAQGNHTQALLDYQLARAELKLMMGETTDRNDK